MKKILLITLAIIIMIGCQKKVTNPISTASCTSPNGYTLLVAPLDKLPQQLVGVILYNGTLTIPNTSNTVPYDSVGYSYTASYDDYFQFKIQPKGDYDRLHIQIYNGSTKIFEMKDTITSLLTIEKLPNLCKDSIIWY